MGAGSALASDPPKGPVVQAYVNATWACQSQLGVPRTKARDPGVHHSPRYWVREKNLWVTRLHRCLERLHDRATALRTGNLGSLPTEDIYALAQQAIQHGGIYSHRWGDVSPILRSLCYEAVRRAFAPFGTEGWARFIVNRESGCNPAAVNTTYSDPRQQATGLSQMIPAVHTWVDYVRVQHDLRYAVQVFVRLSKGGRSTGPWSCC